MTLFVCLPLLLLLAGGLLFWGYRRKHTRNYASLVAAIDGMSGNFSLWDADERLIVFNDNFRTENANIGGIIRPGLTYPDYIAARVAARQLPDAQGREAEWIEGRLTRFRNPGDPVKVELPGGRWHMVGNRRTATGDMLVFGFDITESVVAQQTAEESERRFQDMAAAAADWFWETDADHRFTYMTGNLEHLTGERPEDLLGRSRREVAAPPVIDAIWEAHFATVERQEPFRDFTYRRELEDGQFAWIEISGVPRFAADGTFMGYRGVGRNVTELVTAREALEFSEARFRDFAEAASDIFWELDADLRFISTTKRQDAGWWPDEWMGRTRWGFVGADTENDPHWRKHRRDLEQHRPFRDFGYQFTDHVGVTRQLQVNGKPIFDQAGNFQGYRGTTNDLSPLYRSEEALRENQRRLQSIVDNSSSGIALLDLDHRMRMVNRAYGQMYERTPEELVGQAVFEHLDDGDADDFETQLREAVATGETVIREQEGHQADGAAYYRIVTAFPIRADTGEVTGLGSIVTDVSLLKEAEDRLRQAQKMEAVGQLTGGVAHDFNNLLAVIVGNTELLEESVGTENQQVIAILRATARGAELTARLLAFSRLQPLRQRAFDVGELVSSLRGMLRRTLGETITIETHMAPDLWPVLADSGQVENTLLNLAINARDAMPDGGILTITCENTTLDAGYVAKFEDLAPGDYVMLAVGDAGTGMDADVQARAFEPFFTTKDVCRGTGLGLSMIYGFAKQSGGHVSIDSKAGQGTVVRLYLPPAPHTADVASAKDGEEA